MHIVKNINEMYAKQLTEEYALSKFGAFLCIVNK